MSLNLFVLMVRSSGVQSGCSEGLPLSRHCNGCDHALVDRGVGFSPEAAVDIVEVLLLVLEVKLDLV